MMFISSLGVVYDLESIYADVEVLSAAVRNRDMLSADRLWRDKFERCMNDFFDYLPSTADDPTLWSALTQPLR